MIILAITVYVFVGAFLYSRYLSKPSPSYQSHWTRIEWWEGYEVVFGAFPWLIAWPLVLLILMPAEIAEKRVSKIRENEKRLKEAEKILRKNNIDF